MNINDIVNSFKIMQNNVGYFVAERVPMNNLPGCDVFFWLQISKCYKQHAAARKLLLAISGKRAAKVVNAKTTPKENNSTMKRDCYGCVWHNIGCPTNDPNNCPDDKPK